MTTSKDTLVVQEIFKNVQARDIKAGDITQIKVGDIIKIYKTIINLDKIPKSKGLPQNIISSSTDKFVGRERELELLNQQLQRHNEVVIAAVEGMGGVGKTELAIQYSLLHLQLHTYPGGICWLRAREQDIGLQIVNFARTDLGLQPPDDLELPDRVRWCWKRWLEGNTLIVFDDVKNYSDIKPYLPPQPSQFKVLITTRLKLDLPSSLYLEVLPEPDALELLKQLVGSEKVNQELETARELCQRLGYLPLALQLVGRYVKERRISLTEELRRLEGKGLGHPSLSIPENDPTWTLDIKRGVEAAFELSWEELKKFKFAQELGCLLSLFALAPIPWSLVEGAAVEQYPEELEAARVKLEKLHLLHGEDTYQLHQLIHEFLRDKQNNLSNADEQKYNFCTAIVEVAREIPSIPTPLEITTLIPFIPHLGEAATVYQNWLRDKDLISPFTGLVRFYEGQGDYDKAVSWQEQSFSICQRRLGEEHAIIAQCLRHLAYLYVVQRRYAKAEPLYFQSLKMMKRLFGEKHLEVARDLESLAYLYIEWGRYDKAEPLRLQSLKMMKQLAGKEENLDVAQNLNGLAYLYKLQGRYAEAKPLCLKALEVRKQLLGEEHFHVAQTLGLLADIYKLWGRYAEAEPLFHQALEMLKRLVVEEHPDILRNMKKLGEIYESQGRYAEAEHQYRQALEIAERKLGSNNPYTVNFCKNLEILRKKQGQTMNN